MLRQSAKYSLILKEPKMVEKVVEECSRRASMDRVTMAWKRTS